MKILGLLAGLCGAALASSQASAQSTDGYHAVQVFPMVTDSASFAQRFNFRNPNNIQITVKTRYYPADKFIGQLPMDCNDVVIPALKTAIVTSLRTLCTVAGGGTLPTGSQFGFLYMFQLGNNSNLPFAAFSRVSNPLGNGFTEESFPAHTFTSADVVVNGIRRLAATGGQPTFQTNCFVGILNEINPSGTVTPVHVTLRDSSGNIIGNTFNYDMVPGQITRLLDVFTAVGQPTGDYNDAQFAVDETGPTDPALLAYCTVQDNSFFGADFRIAKQELGAGGMAYPGDVVGSQDNHVTRNTLTSVDSIGRVFNISAGANANTHIVYFRHPDYVACELTDLATTPARLTQAFGLEMRMLDENGLILAGGNNVTGFTTPIYLGDKYSRNGGSNTRYRIEVQDNGSNSGSVRNYKLHCQSGSGHTMGDLIRYHDTVGVW